MLFYFTLTILSQFMAGGRGKAWNQPGRSMPATQSNLKRRDRVVNLASAGDFAVLCSFFFFRGFQDFFALLFLAPPSLS